MKVKVLANIFCLVVGCFAQADSKLAGIELGSDYMTGCKKLQEIVKLKDPTANFIIEKNKCGYQYVIFTGIRSADGKTIDSIRVKNIIFGYKPMQDSRDVAEDYVKSLGAVSHTLEYDNKYSWFHGKNLLGTEKVTIDIMAIEILKIENKINNFDFK